MIEPQAKKEVAITSMSEASYTIGVVCSKDFIEDIRKFTIFISDYHFIKDSYQLMIDPRYDFKEVVEYINNYSRRDNAN